MTRTQNRTDAELQTAIVDELAKAAGVDSAHIVVAIDQGAVTLSGQVATHAERRLAEHAAVRVYGVTAIAERLVRNPMTSPETHHGT